MRGARPLTPGSREKLFMALKTARTKGQYELVLCLWLREALQLNSKQIALGLGMSFSGVRKIQARWLHEGEAMFNKRGRGGRRHEHLPEKAEREFLEELLSETQPANAIVDVRLIHEAYEKLIGRPVSKSVVYRMLGRHDWRPVKFGHIATAQGWAAAKIPPDEPHPERAEVEARVARWLGW